MEINDEVLKWLKANAYAVKEEEYWFLSDFPENQTPDRLEIPINNKNWGKIRVRRSGEGK